MKVHVLRYIQIEPGVDADIINKVRKKGLVRVAKDLGLEKSHLSRFLSGSARMSEEKFDRLRSHACS